MAVQALRHLPGNDFSIDIINKLVDDVFEYADSELHNIRIQLTINTLVQYGILVYMDDTSIPCENINDLFDEDIRHLEPNNTTNNNDEVVCDAEGDDIGGIFDEEEEEFYGNNDCDVDDLFDELMNEDTAIIERDDMPF